MSKGNHSFVVNIYGDGLKCSMMVFITPEFANTIDPEVLQNYMITLATRDATQRGIKNVEETEIWEDYRPSLGYVKYGRLPGVR
jgi:hypothetical protein